jgi:hypothetical protein
MSLKITRKSLKKELDNITHVVTETLTLEYVIVSDARPTGVKFFLKTEPTTEQLLKISDRCFELGWISQYINKTVISDPAETIGNITLIKNNF